MRGLIVLVGLCMLVAACGDTDLNGRPFAQSSAATPASTPTTTEPIVTDVEAVEEPPSVSEEETTQQEEVVVAATTTTEAPQLLAPLQGVALELVAELGPPLAITAPAGDERLYVAQRDGMISVVVDGQVRNDPYLDLTDLVRSAGVEQGLLGLAFHPGYGENGRVFVDYIGNDGGTVVAEYVADPATATVSDDGRVVLAIQQPTDRHNGGALQFGPDGSLYVAVGDGGDGGSNGQKPENLLGTILRIDVDTAGPYAVPADNPFAGGELGAPEVWAYGLRNPWRIWIDHETRLMYIGDVGQADWEEIDVISIDDAGANFGWIYLEGSMCFRAPECRDVPTVLPVLEYSHAEGCSVTGGVVYRGEAIPELDGTYFYADWCRGWMRSFRYDDGEVVDEREWDELEPGQVNTFGVDGSGEMYIGNWSGQLLKLVPIRSDE